VLFLKFVLWVKSDDVSWQSKFGKRTDLSILFIN